MLRILFCLETSKMFILFILDQLRLTDGILWIVWLFLKEKSSTTRNGVAVGFVVSFLILCNFCDGKDIVNWILYFEHHTVKVCPPGSLLFSRSLCKGACSEQIQQCYTKTGKVESINVGTRKMVNYAWPGWRQGKPWWRSVVVLTCKSITGAGYMGERLIL